MLWNDTILSEVYRLQTEEQRTYREIIHKLHLQDVSIEQLRSALRRWRKNNTSPAVANTSHAVISEFVGNSILGIGDLHCPYLHKQFFVEAVTTAVDMDVETVGIVGDLFDFAALSTYPRNEYQQDLSTELTSVRWVLEYLADNFKNIIICNGNHDERLAKRLNANFTLKNLIYATLTDTKIETNLFIIERDYFFVNDTWMFGHPSEYRRTPGELAFRLSKKYGRNVAIWHDHIQGVVSDATNIGISVGGMFEMQSEKETTFYYKERRMSTYPHSSNGYIIIAGESPLLFTPDGLHPLFRGVL